MGQTVSNSSKCLVCDCDGKSHGIYTEYLCDSHFDAYIRTGITSETVICWSNRMRRLYIEMNAIKDMKFEY